MFQDEIAQLSLNTTTVQQRVLIEDRFNGLQRDVIKILPIIIFFVAAMLWRCWPWWLGNDPVVMLLWKPKSLSIAIRNGLPEILLVANLNIVGLCWGGLQLPEGCRCGCRHLGALVGPHSNRRHRFGHLPRQDSPGQLDLFSQRHSLYVHCVVGNPNQLMHINKRAMGFLVVIPSNCGKHSYALQHG